MSNWSFIDHVTDSMSRPRPGDSKHPTLWPSEATAVLTIDGRQVVLGKCRRARFFRFVAECYKFYPKYEHWKPLVEKLEREKKPVDRYMRWIWRQGELYEDYLVEQAKVSGVYSGGQIPLYIKQFNISGKEDIEVVNPETYKFSIVEAKSVYGYGGNSVLGTQAEQRRGSLGKPKDSNIMQIGVYHWWKASRDPAYEASRLVYGSRDTGRYAEYLVETREEELPDGSVENFIWYKGNAPVETAWKNTGISVENIFRQYEGTQLAVDSGVIPDRDFALRYNEEELAAAYKEGELSKTDATQYEKVMARREENKNRLAGGLKPKKELKQVEKGNWQCAYCSYSSVCFGSDFKPREI